MQSTNAIKTDENKKMCGKNAINIVTDIITIIEKTI